MTEPSIKEHIAELRELAQRYQRELNLCPLGTGPDGKPHDLARDQQHLAQEWNRFFCMQDPRPLHAVERQMRFAHQFRQLGQPGPVAWTAQDAAYLLDPQAVQDYARRTFPLLLSHHQAGTEPDIRLGEPDLITPDLMRRIEERLEALRAPLKDMPSKHRDAELARIAECMNVNKPTARDLVRQSAERNTDARAVRAIGQEALKATNRKAAIAGGFSFLMDTSIV